MQAGFELFGGKGRGTMPIGGLPPTPLPLDTCPGTAATPYPPTHRSPDCCNGSFGTASRLHLSPHALPPLRAPAQPLPPGASRSRDVTSRCPSARPPPASHAADRSAMCSVGLGGATDFTVHSGKRCADPKSGPDFGPDYAAASRAPLLPSPAAAAGAVPSCGLTVDSPHRFQLTRRARPLLAAAARAAGSRQHLAGCRIGEYRTSGV